MKKNQDATPAKVISAFLPLIVMGWLYFTIMNPSVKGTYKWDYHGYEQTIVISTRGTNGPCIWRGEDGEETYESFSYDALVYDRPMLHIEGMAYIDVKYARVYYGLDDFIAHRNGSPCRIIR